MVQDSIEKVVDLRAPVSRVWEAITDHRQFGEWFRVALDGPFVVGAVTSGRVTYPGYEHLPWQARVIAIEPERYFAFAWHPLAEESAGLSPLETMVEFTLTPVTSGTRLHIKESGFSRLPDGPGRLNAFRENTEGWTQQAENIADYLDRQPS